MTNHEYILSKNLEWFAVWIQNHTKCGTCPAMKECSYRLQGFDVNTCLNRLKNWLNKDTEDKVTEPVLVDGLPDLEVGYLVYMDDKSPAKMSVVTEKVDGDYLLYCINAKEDENIIKFSEVKDRVIAIKKHNKSFEVVTVWERNISVDDLYRLGIEALDRIREKYKKKDGETDGA